MNRWSTLVRWMVAAAIVTCAAPAMFAASVVDYTTVSDTDSLGLPSISLGGTTVTGSANVTSANTSGSRGLGINGLGVTGIGSDYSFDPGEVMTIHYHSLVTNTTATFYDIEPFGNVTYQYELFAGATSLGVFPVSAHVAHLKTINMSAQSGGQLFDRATFSLITSAPLGLKLTGTSFDRVPEPASVTIAATAASVFCWGFARPRRAGI